MSVDPQETRKIARNWREYLGETKESFRVFGWVWRELIDDAAKKWAKRLLTAALFSTVFAMAQPWLVRWIFDGLAARDLRLAGIGLIGFFACMLLSNLFAHLNWAAREYMMGASVTRVDIRTTELFMAKSLGQHLRDNNALSVANMEKGRSRVTGIQEMLLFNGVQAVFDLVISFVFLWFLSRLVGAVMTGLLANYLVWAVFLNRRCLEACTPIDAEFRRINRFRVERWDKIERVKTCGKEAEEIGHLSERLQRVFGDDRRFWLWFIKVTSVRSLIANLSLIGVVVYGAWLVWHGVWTVGLLFPLFSWSRQFIDNLWRIGQIEHQMNSSLPSVRSMMEALSLQPEVRDRPDAVALPSETVPCVDFARVGHSYAAACLEEGKPAANGTSKAVLQSVSFSVESGEKVALIGASGAGKTTIMRLLQRYMDPEQGSVLVDGRDLRDYRLASWTAALGYIAQQPQVLDGTIRSNLLYGLAPDAAARVTDDDLWTLMRRLKIDFGDRLTDGLDTKVGRNGIKLSGGEAQRLMIGAAAMRQPRFMIIDEATSSLDSTTEKAVQLGLAGVLDDRMSALIIAHRLSTVRHLCTKFVVLKSGDALAPGETQVEAAAGSFEELYRVSPTFRQLADDQGVVIG